MHRVCVSPVFGHHNCAESAQTSSDLAAMPFPGEIEPIALINAAQNILCA
jgi:hypothetical protein